MSLDLTSQFLHDYEELRKKLETSASGPSATIKEQEDKIALLEADLNRLRLANTNLESQVNSLKSDVERLGTAKGELEELVPRLQEVVATLTSENAGLKARSLRVESDIAGLRKLNSDLLEQITTAQPGPNLDSLRAEHEQALKTLKAEHAKSIGRKDKEIHNLMTSGDGPGPTSQAMRGLEAQIVVLTQALAVAKTEAREEALDEVESKVLERSFMPIGPRLGSLILDVVFLVVAAVTIRFATDWTFGVSESWYLFGLFVAFSLMRTFFSPGNLLLGISPRRIGEDYRPSGRVGLGARLGCGMLHYGLIVATGYLAATNPSTRIGLMRLLRWASDPFAKNPGLVSILEDLIKPTTPGLPGIIVATTFVWSAVLIVMIILSPLMHAGTPCFRNTTLVEWMWRIGFERFSPPEREAFPDEE